MTRHASLLSVDQVSKAYAVRSMKDVLFRRPPRIVSALESISMQLRSGEVTALLGPNGAGKTTLINILCDLTRADTGSVEVGGYPLPERSLDAQGEIGYVTTNDRSFFWRLTGRKNLEFFAALQGMSQQQARQRAHELLVRFNLSQQSDWPFHTYSTGMKKRLGIARAFLQDPSVLLMDEPTNGLDARSTEELIDLVRREVAESNKTVLWATHRTEEVERLCDRVIVLIGGNICFADSIDAFRSISRRHQVFTIECRLTDGPHEQLDQFISASALTLHPQNSGRGIKLSGVGEQDELSRVLAGLLKLGVLISQVERRPEAMHKVFAHLEKSVPNVEGGRA